MLLRISFKYNIKASDRGPLIRSLEKATGQEARYLGAPRYEYEVGPWSIYRTGQIDYPDGWPSLGEVTTLLECLKGEGMAPENEDDIHAWITQKQAEVENATNPEDAPSQEQEAEQEEPAVESVGEGGLVADGLTVTIPRDTLTAAALERFKALVNAKGALIQAALKVESLPIEVTDETVSMPWIQRPCTPTEAHALTQLIGAMLTMAREAKRVTVKAKDESNPRYAMRCFLLRLGFIGPEHKALRKTLMGDLPGSAAWRTPPAEDAQPAAKPSLVGRRVRFDDTSDPYTSLTPGVEGSINHVDDLGTLHVAWDNGSTLGLVPGEDSYTLL